MPETYMLCTASLYYPKQHWHTLLTSLHALAPLPSHLAENGLVLAFRHSEQAHLQCSLLVAETAATEAVAWLNDLANYLPPAGRLHEPGVCRLDAATQETALWPLRTSLSLAMLELFRHEEIDDDAVVTAAFYLEMALNKVILDGGHLSHAQLAAQYTPGSRVNEPAKKPAASDAQEQELLQSLHDIKDSIFDPPTSGHRPAWLQHWMHACAQVLNDVGPGTPESRLVTGQGRIVYQLYKQLGLNEQMGLLLYHFVQWSLTDSHLQQELSPC